MSRAAAKPSRRTSGQFGRPRMSRSQFRAALREIRLFLCDVDGVRTSGTVFMGQGTELKEFNIQDGLGLRVLQKCGLQVGWVSARPSAATRARAADLKVDYLHEGSGRKVEAVEGILRKAGLSWNELCFVGDDVVDLGVLRRAGVAVSVANGIDEVRAIADYVTRARGGHGAVREAAELVLKAQGRWDAIVQEHLA